MALPSIGTTLFGGPGSNTTKQIIGNATREFMSMHTAPFREAILSQMSVGNSGSLGRDQKWERTFMPITDPGVYRDGAHSGHFSRVGDVTQAIGEKGFQQQLTQTWPDPGYGLNSKAQKLVGTINSMETNMQMTLAEMDLEATEANIRRYIAPKLIGHGRGIAARATHAFWAKRESNFRLCTIKAGTVTSDYSDATFPHVTFETTEEVTARLEVGMPVDLFDGDNDRINSNGSGVRCMAWIYEVDDFHNKVTVVFQPGDANDVADEAGGTSYAFATMVGDFDGTSDVGDGREYMTYSGVANDDSSIEGGFYSVFDWLKFAEGASPTNAQKRILGSAASATAGEYVDVTVHNQFRSPKYENVGDLSEREFYKILQRTHYGFSRWGYGIDSLFFSFGILARSFALQQAKETIDRTNRPGQINKLGLNGEYEIECDGMTYKAMTEKYLAKGDAVGLKVSGNWEILVPASGASVSKAANAEVPSQIPFEFVSKALGFSSDHMPIMVTDSNSNKAFPTEGVQLPGRIRMQMVVKDNGQIPGVYLTGINTETTFAS